MLKNFKGILLVLLMVLIQGVGKAQSVDAYFYYAPFFAPGIGTYVETYLAFDGEKAHSIMGLDSMHHSMMEVTMLFKNAEEIKEFRKYKVASPYVHDTIVSDTSDTILMPAYIDLQRIIIPNGVYNFELIIKDKYAPDTVEKFKRSEMMTINIPEQQIAFSGIEFLESYEPAVGDNIFVKHGFECIPYVTDFYPKEIENLNLYAEIYAVAKELGPLEDFLLMFHIEQANTGKPIRNFSSFQKQQAKNVNVVFKSIDIRELPSGNYHLVMEVRNRDNDLVSSTRRFFQRSNPEVEFVSDNTDDVDIQQTFVQSFTSADSLAFWLRSLIPISDQQEVRFIDNQLDSAKLVYLQQFFYNFWLKRNEMAPQVAWNTYKFKLDEVQHKYGSVQQAGFETDRGRVYLQYGAPNSMIVERNEEGAYPYEIWHYYKIADLTDKRFVFYSPDLSSNAYELLHSNMLGESNNSFWEQELYSRSAGGVGNGKAKAYFNGN